jgi:homoserine O-acetyltransferase
LVTEEFELEGLLAVVGLSMGGMQTYEWAASHPEFMEAIVPIITMGKTTAWVTAIWETHRRAIMADFDAAEGEAPASDTGFRSAIGGLMVWARHWHWMDEEFAEDNLAVIDWLKGLEDNLAAAWDPINYVYQTRAEDLHDISQAPGMTDDYEEALRSIRARTRRSSARSRRCWAAAGLLVTCEIVPRRAGVAQHTRPAPIRSAARARGAGPGPASAARPGW